MTDNKDFVSIKFTDEFEKRLYRLHKKYRGVRTDIEPIIKQLEKGIFLGDRLSGFGESQFIYKLRVKNSNIKKGKSAGYRLIYLLESRTSVLLLTIYSKSKEQDISIQDIQSILERFYHD